MNIYLVGGALRDELLGLPVTERDYLVVGATEAQMLNLGYRRLDVAFPVFLHPETGDEYALARRERKTGPGYKGFDVDAGSDVSLEQDLARRDLTINALARDGDGRIIDVFHGLDDLHKGILRHITPAFTEDPVRLLRIARFAAKLGRRRFKPADETLGLLREMADFAELDTLVPERLREEMRKALRTEQPWRFFEVLQQCGALQRLLPELLSARKAAPAQGEPGISLPMGSLARAAKASNDIAVRYAAMLGPLEQAGELARRLRLDSASSELSNWVTAWPAQRVLAAGAAELMQLLEQLKLLHHPDRLASLQAVWSAIDGNSGSAAAQRLADALDAATQISAADIAAEGWKGPELGRMLRQQRMAAIVSRLSGQNG